MPSGSSVSCIRSGLNESVRRGLFDQHLIQIAGNLPKLLPGGEQCLRLFPRQFDQLPKLP